MLEGHWNFLKKYIELKEPNFFNSGMHSNYMNRKNNKSNNNYNQNAIDRINKIGGDMGSGRA